MPILSGICFAAQKPFFGFYVNGATLADGIVNRLWAGCNPLFFVLYYPHESEDAV